VPQIRVALFLLCFAPPVWAGIVGTNVPASPLTPERIATLPAEHRDDWTRYLERSQRRFQADQASFQAEMREHGIREPVSPPEGRGVGSIPMSRPDTWYAGPDAKRIADIIVSFQTPAGGWSKNLSMSAHPRAPGERFAHDNASRYLTEWDNDIPHDTHWNYVGTFDNDATITQLRFLAKVINAVGARQSATYRTSFSRGLDYIFAAQYPNGGWPQVWPLQGGYHDAITYNDDAMTNILKLLRDVAAGKKEFSFVPAQARRQASASVKRGIACILASQIRAGDRRTVWCQQHDALTLQPASARNYEMPSQTSSESAQITLFLMDLPHPDAAVVASVHAAAAWFQKTELHDVAVRWSSDGGRRLQPSPGANHLWPRYCEIGTDRPIFGDRDKTIHDSLDEISLERRRGYAWFRGDPAPVLEKYAAWSKAHPLKGAGTALSSPKASAS
jgi:PelA/Pel-15E family pectate lyase